MTLTVQCFQAFGACVAFRLWLWLKPMKERREKPKYRELDQT